MALITLPGGFWAPAIPNISHSAYAMRNSTVIDATGEKFAQLGRAWWPDRAPTKDIVRVHQRFGTVVKAGGSGLRTSLQGISTSASVPIQPNGTPDQTVNIANGDAGFATGLWYRSAALSANRTVAFGEPLAVVTEYDVSGRLGSDSVIFSGLRASAQTGQLGSGTQTNATALYTASWGISDQTVSNCIFEFTDGLFGSFIDSLPCTAASVLTYNNATAGADEYALRFQFPVEVSIDGAWLSCGMLNNTGSVDVVLYEGTTVRRSVTVSPWQFVVYGSAGMAPLTVPFEQYTIPANTPFYLAYKPTTAVSVYLNVMDADNAAHWQAHPWGEEWSSASRVDSGSWTEVATRRPQIGLHVSAVHGASAGGGMIQSRVQLGM